MTGEVGQGDIEEADQGEEGVSPEIEIRNPEKTRINSREVCRRDCSLNMMNHQKKRSICKCCSLLNLLPTF